MGEGVYSILFNYIFVSIVQNTKVHHQSVVEGINLILYNANIMPRIYLLFLGSISLYTFSQGCFECN